MITPISTLDRSVSFEKKHAQNAAENNKIAYVKTPQLKSDVVQIANKESKTSKSGFLAGLRKAAFITAAPLMTIFGTANNAQAQKGDTNSNTRTSIKVTNANADDVIKKVDITKGDTIGELLNPNEVSEIIRIDDTSYTNNFEPIILRRGDAIPEGLPYEIESYLDRMGKMLNVAYIGPVMDADDKQSIGMFAIRSFNPISTKDEVFDFIDSRKSSIFVDEVNNKIRHVNVVNPANAFMYVEETDASDNMPRLGIQVESKDWINEHRYTEAQKKLLNGTKDKATADSLRKTMNVYTEVKEVTRKPVYRIQGDDAQLFIDKIKNSANSKQKSLKILLIDVFNNMVHQKH